MLAAAVRRNVTRALRYEPRRLFDHSLRELSFRVSLGLLAVLVAVSALLRGREARGVPGPWVFPGELIESSLARSFAQTGVLAFRGVETAAYGVVYPLLLSPAFLRGDPSSQYAAARWANAVLMSLAAVPVFLLARRLLPNALSLLAAALALLVPSLAYTGALVTENAYYPIFLLALLAIVRVLESPTVSRQLVALAAIAVAWLTSAQAVDLVATLLLAIVIVSVTGARRDRRVFWPDVRREFRVFWPTEACLVGAEAAAIVVQRIRGRPLDGLLGHDANQVHSYPLGSIPRWFLYHLVDLQLYLGVLPFVPAALVAGTFLWRANIDAGKRAFAAAVVAAVTCALLLAATASSQRGADGGVHERYAFAAAAPCLILFLYWLRHRRDFSTRLLALLLVAGAALPLVLPYRELLASADLDGFALLPWKNHLLAARHVPVAMTALTAVLSLLLFVRRGTIVMLEVGLVAATLFLVGRYALLKDESAAAVPPSSFTGVPSWVDAAVPHGARVAVLWAPDPRWGAAVELGREQALWRAELFNPSVTSVYYTGAPMRYRLPEGKAKLQHGRVVVPAGSAPFRYVLVASDVALSGDPVALDPQARLTLYRLRKPAQAARG